MASEPTPSPPRARWSSLRGGWWVMTAGDGRLASHPASVFDRAWAGVLAVSLAWGVLSIALWEAALRLFDLYSGFPLMPVALLVPAAVLGVYRRSVLEAGRLLGGRDPVGRSLAAGCVVVALTLTLLGIKGLGWREEWPANLGFLPHWLRPRATYRVLLLAPLWGAWGMLTSLHLGRPDESTEPAVRRMRAGFGPAAATLVMALLLGGSMVLFNYLPWWQVGIGGSAIVAALVGGWVLGRLTGGLRRCTLLVVNLLTQWIFLLAYLSIRRAGRW